jgi:rod shape-determining protein MreC
LRLIEEDSSKVKFFVNALVIIISIYFASTNGDKIKKTSAFEGFLIESFAPIQSGISYLQRKSSTLFKDYLANISASRNNRELHKKVRELENVIFSFNELAKENQRLKNLLQFGKEIPKAKVLAQIVAWDASSDFLVIRINKGALDGIKLQSTVVTSEGLVGYIYRLTDHFSDILTILDSKNRVDGIVERIRAHGVIEGFSDGRCIMKYVTRTEPIILNDIVITSGLGNVYPKGIKVGTVSKIERESFGITQRVEISPSVNFGKLEEVVVLVSKDNVQKKLEWEALDKSHK